jgi:molecular chaperone GrpE
MTESEKNEKVENADVVSTDRAELNHGENVEPLGDSEQALRGELEQALAQANEWREKAYRTAADLDNARKRFQKERTELRSFGVEPLVQDLLPVADNLERAIAHASAENNLAEGVKMVLRQLMQVLAAKGAVPFEAKGELFDPSIHEAMSQIPSADHPAGTVIEVFQKGWMLKERLIRPAMVVVASECADQTPSVQDEPTDESVG